MILKTKITNNLVNFDSLENSHLSILISLDEFSFSIFDKDLVDVILLYSYDFDTRVKTPDELLKNITEIFEKEPILTKKYESINVAHKNNLSAMVPEALYEKDSQMDYLKYTVRVLQNDEITVDSISEIDSKNVFIPFVNINNYLVDKLGSFDYLHASSILVSSLLQKYKTNLDKQLFVNVSNTSIDVVYIDEGELKMYNSFLYYSKEDFLYFVLFTMERLQLNPNEQEITFIGNVNKGSDLYELTYKYVRNINFLKDSNFALSEDFFIMNPEIQKHHYFELLNQF